MAIKIPKATKALVWDLDGTIIDSFGIVEEIIGTIAPMFNKPTPGRKTMLHNYHGSLRDSIQGYFGGNIDDAELDKLTDAFLQHQHKYYEAADGHLLEDALSLADRAHQLGLYQVIVTNRAHNGRGNASPRYIVENSRLKDHVDEVICADEVQYNKPDRRVLDNFLRDKKLTGAEVIVIGDQYVDAELAFNLGTDAILIARGSEPIAHIEKLPGNWQKYLTIVKDLKAVEI